MAQNVILSQLPSAESAKLAALSKPVTFEQGAILYEAGAPIEWSYFPHHGTLSSVVVMLDGRMIETATVGNEGLVGLPRPFMSDRSPNRVIVQIPGNGLRIETRLLEREIERSATLQRLFIRYQSAYFCQVSQSVACNGLHTLHERSCRWLLMTHDRSGNHEVKLTHEFLAVMLGVRRASVSETLQELQESGLVTYSRGSITILNRAGLEKQSCECYHRVAAEYATLLR
jgi:CRP-like cAMP-binding protein